METQLAALPTTGNDISVTVALSDVQIIQCTSQNNNSKLELKIKKSENEGDYNLQEVLFLRKNILKTILSIILIIFSFGIFGILLAWYPKLRKKFFYSIIDLEQATFDSFQSILLKITHTFIENKQYVLDPKTGKKKVSKQFQFIEKFEISQYNNENYGYFFYQNLKYILKLSQDKITKSTIILCEAIKTKEQQYNLQQFMDHQILQQLEVKQRQLYFGKCLCEIVEPKFYRYMGEQLISPPFIIQYVTTVSFFYRGFGYVGAMFIGFSLTFCILNFWTFTMKSYKKLKEQLEITQKVKVFRKDDNLQDIEQEIDSKFLVPGDKLVISQDLKKIPCDILLIQEDVFLNEASLTGESVPINKFPVTETDLPKNEPLDFEKHKKHILFEGTEIIPAGSRLHEKQIMGIVIRTGFTTCKGQIFRSVISPQEDYTEFLGSLLWFVSTIALTVGLTYAVMWKNQQEGGMETKDNIFLLFCYLADNFPAALPVMFSISISGALFRLRKQKISCRQPQKLLSAQNISKMAFDKTGTLTISDINLETILDKNLDENFDRNSNQIIPKILATCHQIQILDDGEILGDSLEVSMFKWSEATKDKQGYYNLNNETLKILKIFEYESKFSRMSVITQVLNTNEFYLLVKGAPEIIQELSIKSTIPQNFKKVLNKMGIKGFRNLGMASKSLTKEEVGNIIENGINRDEVEKDLNFEGLLGFQNPLKPDSSTVVKELIDGEFHCVIISGDNPMTTIACSIEANFIPSDVENIIILDIDDNDRFNPERLDIDILHKSKQNDDLCTSIKYYDEMKNYSHFVATGKFFRAYTNQTLQINPEYMDLINDILINKTRVFARQKPDQKAQIIQLLQSGGTKVGMIGDGANDCAAIGQADLGISFSFGDAQFSSPFQYLETDLKVVPAIIKDAKTCVATVVDQFRLGSVINFIKYSLFFVASFEYSALTSNQIVYIIVPMTFPVTIFLANGKTYHKKVVNIPISCNFLTLENFLTVYSAAAFNFAALFSAYMLLENQHWHLRVQKEQKQEGDLFVRDPSEIQTTLLLVSLVMLDLTIIKLIQGAPVRDKFVKQHKLLYYTTGFLVLNTSIFLIPGFGNGFLQLQKMPYDFIITIFFICFGFGLGLVITDTFIKRYTGVKKDFIEFKKRKEQKQSQQTQNPVFKRQKSYSNHKKQVETSPDAQTNLKKSLIRNLNI